MSVKNVPIDEVVARVNKLGLRGAAQSFSTSTSTLSRLLRATGHRIKRQYVKELPATHQP